MKELKRTIITIFLASALCGLILVGALSLDLPPMQISPQTKNSTVIRPTLAEKPHTSLAQKILSLLPLAPRPLPEELPAEASVVTAIIENHEDARPQQKGLREAEAVFELIVEGDISRFLAIFRSDRLPDTIGPIRSLRPHILSIAEIFHPLLLHIGGSGKAYDALAGSSVQSHDGIRYDGETYHRDTSIAPPHNLFMDRGKLENLLTGLPMTTFPLFPRGEVSVSGSAASVITLAFGSPLHDVTYTYDPEAKTYLRSIHNSPEQGYPSNVLVLETTIEGYGVLGAIPWTQTFGEGKAVLFRDGEVYEARWIRDKGKPFSFTDPSGNVLPLAEGQVWITIFPTLEMVAWE